MLELISKLLDNLKILLPIIKNPPPQLFLAVGIVSFVVAFYAGIIVCQRTRLKKLFEIEYNKAKKEGGLAIIIPILILILAIIYAYASFVEMNVGLKWPEVMPEPNFSHLAFTIFISSLFAFMIFFHHIQNC